MNKRADVGFEGLSGNRMLDQSITGSDPQRTWRSRLFDHLVGAGEDRRRDREAERHQPRVRHIPSIAQISRTAAPWRIFFTGTYSGEFQKA